MMQAVGYLMNELKAIANNFPQVHVKYSYNNRILTHIVELHPLSEFTNNVALDDAWIPLSFAFRENFPEEEIAFVSSDSSLQSDSPIFEYNVPVVCNEKEPIDEIFSSISASFINYDFPNQIPDGMLLDTGLGEILNRPAKKHVDFIDPYHTYLQAA